MKRIYLIFCLLLLSGCGTLALSQVKMVQSGLKRSTTTTDQTDVQVFTASEQDFAFDLYRMLSTQPGNIVFSPHSLYLNLMMDYSGARGETERQMAEVLHLALPADRVHAAANALDQDLSSSGNKEDNYQLIVSDSLWAQQDFSFNAAYLDLLAQYYGTGIRLVDYKQDQSRQQAVQAINQWASDQTRGKINNLVVPSALTFKTRLVLANTIYFNAQWLDRFEPMWNPVPFTLRDGSQVQAPFITSQRHDNKGASINTSGRYPLITRGDGITVVEVPYKGSRASFVALMPTDNYTLAGLEADLTSDKLRELLTIPADHYNVFVEMPKFNFEAPLELSDSLGALGMPDAFDDIKADFSGMNGKKNIIISAVAQKTTIHLNELGTEAASASYTGFIEVAMPISIRIDRPFLFLILDRPTGAILFMGRVDDPR